MIPVVLDARGLLTYEVTISRPDSYRRLWWQVGNAGRPAQAAAALSELATRCAVDLPDPTGYCWYMCDVRTADDVQLDYFVGAVHAAQLGDQLRTTAARILDITAPGMPGSGTAGYSLPPRSGR